MTCLIVVELCHDQTRLFLGIEAGELEANLRGKPYRSRFSWKGMSGSLPHPKDYNLPCQTLGKTLHRQRAVGSHNPLIERMKEVGVDKYK